MDCGKMSLFAIKKESWFGNQWKAQRSQYKYFVITIEAQLAILNPEAALGEEGGAGIPPKPKKLLEKNCVIFDGYIFRNNFSKNS